MYSYAICSLAEHIIVLVIQRTVVQKMSCCTEAWIDSFGGLQRCTMFGRERGIQVL